jgi:hypothetical protein
LTDPAPVVGRQSIGRTAEEIFERAERIYLGSELSAAELEQAQAAYPGERFEAGIGEHFAAGRELVQRFRNGLETNPHGFAVSVSALDWRRAGVERPIINPELRRLYSISLRRFHPLLRSTDDDFKHGLEWATKPLASRAALLMPRTNGEDVSWEIFDYIRDWADGELQSNVDPRLHAIPKDTWDWIIQELSPEDLTLVWYTAYSRADFDACLAALRKARIGSHDPTNALVMSAEGAVLRELGRPEEAVVVYDQVVERFGEAPEPALREQVAMALVNKRSALER